MPGRRQDKDSVDHSKSRPAPAVKPRSVTRVDVDVAPGTEELLPEDVYRVYSPTGLWITEEGTRTVISAYPQDVGTYLTALQQAGIPVGEARVIEEPFQDYSETAKRYFRPITIEDVVIRTPWNGRRAGVEYITIEPGMAFGTGRHESTRLMMKLMRDVDLKGKRVLDLGCGSGILSLYARLKGARRVRGVDFDPDAVQSARDNLRLNDAAGVDFDCADVRDVSGRFDVVLANLDIRTFGLTAEHIVGLVKRKEGVLIVSGIIGRERKDALALFAPREPEREVRKNAWRGFLFRG